MLTRQGQPRRRLYILTLAAIMLMLSIAVVRSPLPTQAGEESVQAPNVVTPNRTPSPTRSSTPTQTFTAPPSSTPTPTKTLQPPQPSATSTSASVHTSTPVPTATTVPCINSGQIVGAITTSDPVQTGRLNRDGVASSCQSPKTCPLMIDPSARHYDAYRFTNTMGAPSCFTVSINAGTCVDTRYIFSAAYLTRFDPTSLCTNYLADIGASPLPVGSYSFTVPAGASFEVVVYEIDPNVGCPSYSLNVTNCQACTTQFVDVLPDNTFYGNVRCLACRGIVSGYADGTFRPNNLVTRGQLAKVVSNAGGFQEDPGAQIYEDVPPSHPFYQWIQRLSRRSYIGGYPCGGPGEPCVTSRPYFRPVANATRSQTAKIVASAANYNEPPAGQTFEDVPPSHPFYQWIQRLAARGIMGGYTCGGPGEPCVNNRPYFRPNNLVTRGQSAKIVANAFYPNCSIP